MLLQGVEHEQLLEDLRLGGLPDLPGQEHLVHDRVDLVEVEHEVQLADVVEVLVEHLHEVVDGLQVAEIVVVHVHADAEVQPCVAPVHDLEVTELEAEICLNERGIFGEYLDEVGVLGVPDCDDGVHLLDELLLLVVVEVHVPLGQPRLAGPVLDQDEADLQSLFWWAF